ncbi:MAG: restriction endonuclease [Chloroflexi bacterium]|nr:restriction endonuclease [Chloroflexota bacterium]
MQRWKLLEFVALAIELYHSRGESTQVTYDDKIPEISSSSRRQVDISLRSTAAEHEFLRIVEVQDRIDKIGSPFIDLVGGKLAAIGAHRATIVSTAGFTAPAIEKLRNASDKLDGFTLRKSLKSDWVKQWGVDHVEFTDGQVTHNFPLESLTFEKATTGEASLVTRFADVNFEGFDGAHVIIGPTGTANKGEASVNYQTYTIGTMAADIEFPTSTLTYRTEDGVMHSVTENRKSVSNLTLADRKSIRRRRNRF